MKEVSHIIIIENNTVAGLLIEKRLREEKYKGEIKITVNGGHAMLYMEYLFLTKKITPSKILILLNINTPIIDGIQFLNNFKKTKNFPKEHIIIITLEDELTAEKKEQIKNIGYEYFISGAFSLNDLNKIITQHCTDGERSCMA
ncbi:MAG: hypothetical protein K2X86_18040 [Cytophagaceae bacterium]|nr:hypothetical protein [Cytophagaceae bacterium]